MSRQSKKNYPEFISDRINTLGSSLRATDYLRKVVLSKSGEKVGIVRDIVFHGHVFVGLLIGKNLFIDSKFVHSVADDAVMLSIEPVTLLRGKIVFDADGRQIGKVKDVVRRHTGNDYESILVKKGIFRKPIAIPKSHVKTAGKNIILNTSYEL
ncbi:hypothetical protein D6764_00225 [Candidatus Woesearchaeota archaeon]|nr:MAG: hypothetical protein D6764_00225 [Candidatus Woesearchaeota archaeon]